jgi:hypothetical protein
MQTEAMEPASLAAVVDSRLGNRLYWPRFCKESSWITWNQILYVILLIECAAGDRLLSSVLGATEAGLFPGVIYVFSVYYLRWEALMCDHYTWPSLLFRHERSWRVAVFFGGSALAGAFGGIIYSS